MKRLLILFTILLTGCAKMPTQAELDSADYGGYPANYEQIATDFIRYNLKDPSSLQVARISQPQRYFLGDRIEGGVYGYLVCVTYNAKNSFGGYAGYSNEGVLIRNDRIIKNLPKGYWGGNDVCSAVM